MAPLEIRCDVDSLSNIIRAAKARIIGIDGCDGAGKTFLAKQLADILNLPIVDFDSFLNRNRGAFVQELKLAELSSAIQDLETSRGVIISGICLLEILNRINVSLDFMAYVKRYSKYDIPSDLYMTDIKKELCKYHRDFKPSLRADVIFVRQEKRAL